MNRGFPCWGSDCFAVIIRDNPNLFCFYWFIPPFLYLTYILYHKITCLSSLLPKFICKQIVNAMIWLVVYPHYYVHAEGTSIFWKSLLLYFLSNNARRIFYELFVNIVHPVVVVYQTTTTKGEGRPSPVNYKFLCRCGRFVLWYIETQPPRL